MPEIREARPEDITRLEQIRNSVRENELSDPAIIKRAHYDEFLFQRGKGWVCLIGNIIAGFAIVDLKDDNVWALFVDPQYESRGAGRMLQYKMLNWYFDQGKESIWLSTAPETRAEMFYHKSGWKENGVHGKGEIRFEMTREQWENQNRSRSA